MASNVHIPSAFIDTATGAWGSTAGLVLVDLDADEINALMDAPDSVIVTFGTDHGITLGQLTDDDA